ncbi:MAG: hypothetical protein OER92_02030 [Alphaproteobacteria bacterium]|nr:hypothetical protein [Alphaproteobacteria bacterium]
MDDEMVVNAAALLVHARQTGEPLQELPEVCRPVTAAEANAIGDEIARQLGEPIGGWKISFLYKPREVPFISPLFESRIFPAPAEIPASLTPSLFIEPEITFRLEHDLPPRERLYRPDEVAASVVACPSFEIVDTRFDTSARSIRQRLNERASLVEVFADHQTSGAFIAGNGRTDWSDFDFARMRVVMRANDEVIVETCGGHAFSDPFLPLVVLANEMRHRDGLRAGQLLATGSFSGFFPVEVGQKITAEFENFGTVEAIFVDR